MATRIPLPGQGGEALQRGVEQGTGLWQQLLGRGQQQAQMQQEWQQHLRNAAIREQQEARLRELQPYLISEHQGKAEAKPLQLDLLRAKIEHENAKAEKAKKAENPTKAARQEQLVNSHQWNSMPSSSKENLVALANGLGIRPDDFVRGMTQGKTFEEIAAEHGLDPAEISKVIPKYLATTSNVTQENERQKNLAELGVFEETVTDWMAPYIRKVAGMSPQQIVDTLKGENIDALAKYYAALSLQPEIAALRIKVMGGNMSHAGLEEIVKASFGKSAINESMVGPEVYKKMNHYLQELLHKGSAAATHSIYGRPSSKKEQKPSAYEESQKQLTEKENSGTVIKTYNRKTGKAE